MLSWSPASGNILSHYGQDGVLRYQNDFRTNQALSFIYLAGSQVATHEMPFYTGSPSVKYHHTDALGSPVATTDATQAVVQRSEYEPFGALINRANDNRPGYTGHVMDAETGLTYMQQRSYDPAIGRFLSVDPVTADGNTGGNFNRYWYANNNPYKFTDPDGREAELNGFDPSVDPRLYKSAQAYNSPKGVYTITAHSRPLVAEGRGLSHISARLPGSDTYAYYTSTQIWDAVKKDFVAGGYSTILLAVCGAGITDAEGWSFAERLSYDSGAQVLSTKPFVGFPDSGSIFIGDGVKKPDGHWGATPKKGETWQVSQGGQSRDGPSTIAITGRVESAKLKRESSR